MSEYPTYLIHYGIEGQRWGHRRFQNEDGTYTNEGLERRREEHSSGKKIFKSGVKSTASGVGDAFRAGNRTVRGAAKTALRGNVVFAKNALSGVKSGFKTAMNKGDAEKGLDQIKQGFKTGADKAYEAKKQVAKESADSVKSAAASSAKKIASGALGTAAGTAKMAKAQVAIKKENDIKTDISKSGYNVDKWGYAKKEKNGMTYMFDTDKNTGDSREKLNTINNLEKSISVINKNLDKEVNRIIKDELDGWNIPEKHNIKLKSIFVYDKSTAEANYWDDSKNDPLGGHEITIEFDPKTKKYRMYSLNG